MNFVPLTVRGRYALIHLTRGRNAKVDLADWPGLMVHRWSFNPAGKGYAMGRRTLMHRKIMEAPPGVEIDHEDRDGLNNQRRNLRFATHSQNMTNRDDRENKSGFRGVYRHKFGKWAAEVYANGKRMSLGYHASAEDAARAYDKFAAILHGEFAVLNFSRPRAADAGRGN